MSRSVRQLTLGKARDAQLVAEQARRELRAMMAKAARDRPDWYVWVTEAWPRIRRGPW